jgi:hypothetical protein
MRPAQVGLALRAAGEAPTADHRFRTLGNDVVVRPLGAVLGLEEQPLGLAALRSGPDQMPAALQLLSVEEDVEVAFLQLLPGLPGGIGVVRPAVPDDAVAGAVLAVGDATLEVAVLQWMVLGLHRQPLLGRVVAGPLGTGEADQHPVQLQPDVVVEPGGVVLVHHEAKWTARGGSDARRRRFGGDREITLLAIGGEWVRASGHGAAPGNWVRRSTPAGLPRGLRHW